MLLFYYINYNVIWACIVSAIVAAAAVTAFFLLKGKGKKSADDMKPSEKKELILGIRDNAELFADLYEPLFILASGKAARKDWVFDSWNNAVNSIEGYEGFKTAFAKRFGDVASFKGKSKKYIKSADKLLKYVFKAGIERDDDATVKADENTAEKYDIIGAASLVADEEYDVFVPYWSIEKDDCETVLSKGAIR